MSVRKDISDPEPKLQEIAKWSQRYAQNRTLPRLIFLLIWIPVSAAAMACGFLLDWSLATHHRGLTVLAVLVLCAWGCAIVWFLFLGGGKVLLRPLGDRLYRREGLAALDHPQPSPVLLLIFLGCWIAATILGAMGLYPLRYVQPITATFTVPYLSYVIFRLRGTDSPFLYLLPGLYGLHALLLLLGAPLNFRGQLAGLDVALPMIAYGLLAALAGHLYSRFALRKLRRLAALSTAEAEEAP